MSQVLGFFFKRIIYIHLQITFTFCRSKTKRDIIFLFMKENRLDIFFESVCEGFFLIKLCFQYSITSKLSFCISQVLLKVNTLSWMLLYYAKSLDHMSILIEERWFAKTIKPFVRYIVRKTAAWQLIMKKWNRWIFADESQLYDVTFPKKKLSMHLISIWISHWKKLKITAISEGEMTILYI